MSAACNGRPDATISVWSVHVTAPPASRTRSSPAAESHGERDTSKYASTRPAATHARSSAADPARRMSRTVPATRERTAACAARSAES